MGIWEFPKIRGYPYFGVLKIRILLFSVLIKVPYFRKLPYVAIVSKGLKRETIAGALITRTLVI